MSQAPKTLEEAIRSTQEPMPLNQALFRFPRREPRRATAPLAFVERLNDEKAVEDMAFGFVTKMQKDSRIKKPQQLPSYTPQGARFRPVLQESDGGIFFLVRWSLVDQHTISLMEDFCLATRRRLGWYNSEAGTISGIPDLDLKKCKLITEDELATRFPPPQVPEVSILDEARNQLAKRTPQRADVRVWDFKDDEEAHDKKLRQQVDEEAHEVAREYEAELTEKYGLPLKPTVELLNMLPVCGLLHGVVWQVKSKKLFLAVTWEDVGLPYAIVLGTLIDKQA